jgi:hypothetical protein
MASRSFWFPAGVARAASSTSDRPSCIICGARFVLVRAVRSATGAVPRRSHIRCRRASRGRKAFGLAASAGIRDYGNEITTSMKERRLWRGTARVGPFPAGRPDARRRPASATSRRPRPVSSRYAELNSGGGCGASGSSACETVGSPTSTSLRRASM